MPKKYRLRAKDGKLKGPKRDWIGRVKGLGSSKTLKKHLPKMKDGLEGMSRKDFNDVRTGRGLPKKFKIG